LLDIGFVEVSSDVVALAKNLHLHAIRHATGSRLDGLFSANLPRAARVP
jgi:hypothetical protein